MRRELDEKMFSFVVRNEQQLKKFSKEQLLHFLFKNCSNKKFQGGLANTGPLPLSQLKKFFWVERRAH